MTMLRIREFCSKSVINCLTGAIFISTLMLASSLAVAGGFNWGAATAGALSGAGKATSEIADQEIRLEQQKKLMEYQYELERQRIQQQHELDMQRQQAAFEQQRIADENARRAASVKAVGVPSNYFPEKERMEAAKSQLVKKGGACNYSVDCEGRLFCKKNGTCGDPKYETWE